MWGIHKKNWLNKEHILFGSIEKNVVHSTEF